MQIPLIIYEDNHLLVLKKPPGWLAQPDGRPRSDILFWARDYLVKSKNKPGKAYVGLCHRLDRKVGGVMVLAKTSKAASRLCLQFREHKTQKFYLAIATGCPKQTEGFLEQNLYRDGFKTRLAAWGEKETLCSLRWRLLSTGQLEGLTSSFLEIELITGFKHQIRAQLALMGNPLWGDSRYGGPLAPVGEESLGLFAHRLSFFHPTGGQFLSFEAQADFWPFSCWPKEVLS
jgi:23S rRNA pseudouridine1911/1915/1917 synthase